MPFSFPKTVVKKRDTSPFERAFYVIKKIRELFRRAQKNVNLMWGALGHLLREADSWLLAFLSSSGLFKIDVLAKLNSIVCFMSRLVFRNWKRTSNFYDFDKPRGTFKAQYEFSFFSFLFSSFSTVLAKDIVKVINIIHNYFYIVLEMLRYFLWKTKR